jgi:glycosyltransferase involved in cell wall biosynthesis
MTRTFLTALPVYNEERHLPAVLPEVLRYSPDDHVVDDGSQDGTADLLRLMPKVRVCRHATNEGYGAALRTAFDYAIEQRFDVLVTIDCDGQHQPALIPRLVEATHEADIVSGSRYLEPYDPVAPPPEARRQINVRITAELNRALGLNLTDAFCGFKAYRVDALRKLRITEPGYGMPLQLWVQAARLGLRVTEVPVPLIYLEEHRSFGGALDEADTRLRYYHGVLRRALEGQP